MKKNKVIYLAAACTVLAMLLGGCGSVGNVTKAVMEADKTKEASAPSGEAVEKDKTQETKESASGIPVLGAKDIEGYEGFTYLYDEVLMTDSEENEDTGKMEKEELTVYIPKADYTDVNRTRAYSEKLGVVLQVELDPYLQDKQEDYLPKENLQVLLDGYYDEFYSVELEDLNVSEIVTEKDGSASAVVSYCEFNDWDDDYSVVYVYYNVKELESGTCFLTEIEVGSYETTGKTEDLLKELETFYQFPIAWNKEEADKKLETYMASDKGDSKKVSSGYLLFDLPAGWEEDEDFSTYDEKMYAPGGDAAFAGCSIYLVEEYIGEESESIGAILGDESLGGALLEEFIGEDAENLSTKPYGETCIGDTAEISYQLKDDYGTYDVKCYMAGKNGYIYMIQAQTTGDATEDVFTVVKDVLENGKLRN